MVLPQFQPITLKSKRFIARDILELEFFKPAGFNFLAGQFVQFKIPENNSFVLRSFSICSSPAEDALLFCTKVLPGGVASALFCSLAEGETIEISPATGQFVCRPEHAPRKIFIAAGTGLAPIRGMIADRFGSPDSLHLLFGVRSEPDIFWDEEFKALQAQFPNFYYQLTLSRPSDTWAGARGRVSAHLPALINPAAEYYICGSLEMVKDVRQILLEHKIGSSQIHFEIF